MKIYSFSNNFEGLKIHDIRVYNNNDNNNIYIVLIAMEEYF